MFLYNSLKPHIFDTLRLLTVIFVVVLRFALMPIYLQSYLNLASERIVNLRQEAGRITNIDYQKKVNCVKYIILYNNFYKTYDTLIIISEFYFKL